LNLLLEISLVGRKSLNELKEKKRKRQKKRKRKKERKKEKRKKLYCFSSLPRPQLYTFDLGHFQDSQKIQKLSSRVWC